MTEFEPMDFADMPRFGGVATFMRLPVVEDPAEVDVAIIGVPWDGGTTNRAGARHGPRGIRDMSGMIRPFHPLTGRSPYKACRVADLGDVGVNPTDPVDTLARVEAYMKDVVEAGAAPLAAGGDHLTSLPILRALGRGGAVGMVHFDAHSDTTDLYFGTSRYTHGTPFRRAVEEGVLDPKRTVQIGLRGSRSSPGDMDFARDAGMRLIAIEELFEIGVEAVSEEARRVVGGGPVYISFDIDGLDPAYAPGTGTPEVGGFSTHQAQRMIRGLDGLDIVGGDVVEVSPPFDVAGITALAAANLMYEILCVLAPAVARRKSPG